MFRPMPLLGWLLGSVLLALPALGRAQPSLPEQMFDPLGPDAKELARAAFEAERASPRDLTRARLEAARLELSNLRWLQRMGQRAFDPMFALLLGAVASVTEADLATLEKPTPEDRRAILAVRWLYALSGEQNAEAKYRAGRIYLSSFMEARQARLDAEIKLREVWRDASAPFLLPSMPFDQREPYPDFDPKETAKRAFEAVRADPHDLAATRRDAARLVFMERLEKYRAGAPDATLDSLLKSAARLADAERAAVEKPTPADRRAAVAAHWLAAWVAESIAGAGHHVGRVSLANVMQARYARLDAEIRLRSVGEKFSAPSPVPALLEERDLYLNAKEAAKAAFEAGQSDPHGLAAARLDAIRVCYVVRAEKFRQGAQGVTLGLLLETARRLLDAELAVSESPARRLAAHQRYLGQLRTAEEIERIKHEVGRASLADHMQVRGQRLEAEIRLREARDEASKK